MTTPADDRVRCAVCRANPAAVSVLCQTCRAALLDPIPLAPEQIVSQVVEPTIAALVDRWGRPHRLAPTTQLGRSSDNEAICILTPTVSRRHADIVRIDNDTWVLRDLGSSNGTSVDDERVADEVVLQNGQLVTIGRVAFYFLSDVRALPHVGMPRANTPTMRPDSESEVQRVTGELTAQPDEVAFELQQPTGGGGAVMRVAGKSVQLTIAQHDLMILLVERMLAELDADPSTRGFVSMEELQLKLSLESTDAASDNVRQLVRRVRKLLLRAGVGDLIESRPGRGYRLLVIPRLD